MSFSIVTRNHALRDAVERHVARVYAQAYGARIREFPDMMVAMADGAGGIRCAAGLRTAADGFFSEAYLDRPFEDALTALAGERVARGRIIEITSLASGAACTSKRLIHHIVGFARDAGTDWAVFTITPRLGDALRRLSLPVVGLVGARADRLANAADWGRYYETGPMVAAMRDPGPAHLPLAGDRSPHPRSAVAIPGAAVSAPSPHAAA